MDKGIAWAFVFTAVAAVILKQTSLAHPGPNHGWYILGIIMFASFAGGECGPFLTRAMSSVTDWTRLQAWRIRAKF